MRSDPDDRGETDGRDDESHETGSDDGDGRPEDSPLPDCPRCGTPVGFVTATGPMTASVTPCGCTVPPALVQRDD